MKQQITVKQLSELPFKDFIVIRDWKHTKGLQEGLLLNIGEMLQFLYERVDVNVNAEPRESQSQGWFVNEKSAVELCDALWMCVKDVVKNEKVG